MSMDNTGSQILGRREFLAAATAATMAGGSVHAQADLPPGRFEMTVINPEVVSGGCGLCVIMRTPAGRTYLFDTANGVDGAVKNNGKDIIVPWLKKRGIGKIDGLILSHYHSDHFGGLLYLADHFEIGHVFDNSFEPLNAYGNGEVDCAKRCLFNWEKKHPGQVTRYLVEGDDLGWNEPGVRFDVVWPPKTGYCKPLDRGPDYKRNGSLHHLLNANSTGLRIRVGKIDYLILGDINAARRQGRLPDPRRHQRRLRRRIHAAVHGAQGCVDRERRRSPLPRHPRRQGRERRGDEAASRNRDRLSRKPEVDVRRRQELGRHLLEDGDPGVCDESPRGHQRFL